MGDLFTLGPHYDLRNEHRQMMMKRFDIRIGAVTAALLAMVAAPASASQEAPPEEDDLVQRIGPGIIRLPGSNELPSQPDDGEPDAAPTAQRNAPSVLAILAQPDDELMIAPVLSRFARSGGEVTVIFAASADAELEDEARCAAFALGLAEPEFWQLDDGTATDMSERIASLITLHEPRAIMTWSPDGGYGHADHRMVGKVTTQAVQSISTVRPDLLYGVFPTLESEDSLWVERQAVIDPSLITDSIEYERRDLEAMRLATDCYQSRFDDAARAALPTMLHRDVWAGTVDFQLAFPSQL